MNTISTTNEENILYSSFNQDASCFTMGTEKGFIIYNSVPFIESFERPFDAGIGIVEMLYRSNILALVGGGYNPKYTPNKVILWDDHKSQVIGELRFTTNVINVKLKKAKYLFLK